ncbi:TRAP transporter small permease [Hoeflea sp. TYP-13]|uniref:TRAP transporter small permease n=1 Tax=Hoeflea sp. TYP-13 TaxID=3230023 RepID=UPI0034C61F00
MKTILKALRILNEGLTRLAMTVGLTIVGIMVVALTASAATRFVSGQGYDWLIELPPALVPWLVFPLLGPLLRSGQHIQVDLLPALIGPDAKRVLMLVCYAIAFGASIIFLIAGGEAVALFRRLGQLMELEIEVPIWWMYLAFPVGFTMLASFSLELFLETANEIVGQRDAEKSLT